MTDQVLILAGSYQLAKMIAAEFELTGHTWQYIDSMRTLLGIRRDRHVLFVHESGVRRDDYVAIVDRCADHKILRVSAERVKTLFHSNGFPRDADIQDASRLRAERRRTAKGKT